MNVILYAKFNLLNAFLCLLTKVLYFKRNTSLKVFLLFLLSNTAFAEDAIETLEKNEGYVVVPIIIRDEIPWSIRLKGKKMFGGSYTARDLSSGENFQVVKLPAGQYQWSRINLVSDFYFDLENHSFNLTVKPGVINYGGHLILNINRRFGTAQYDYVNRSSLVIEQLTDKFYTLSQQYNLEFTGHSPDPFISHYQNIIKTEQH